MRGVLGEVPAREIDIGVIVLRVEHTDGLGAPVDRFPVPGHRGVQRGSQPFEIVLGQVVIGTGLERRESRLLIARPGEDDDGGRDGVFPDPGQQLQPAAVRQPEVEQGRVEAGRRSQPGLGLRDGSRRLEQHLGRRCRQASSRQISVDGVVFDVQDTHGDYLGARFNRHQYDSICAATSRNLPKSTGLTM